MIAELGTAVLAAGGGAAAAGLLRARRGAALMAAARGRLNRTLEKQREAAEAAAAAAGSCAALERELEEVSIVYHCLKKMEGVLGFAETLQAWCESLREWARFERAVLALVEKNEAGTPELKNIYEIGLTRPDAKPAIELANARHAAAMRGLLQRLSPRTRPLPLEPGLAFPLLAEGELVGIFALPGEWGEKEETLQFLVNEFSLEIKKKMLYEKIKELSIVDSASGLYQRRYFFDQLGFELERARESGAAVSVLLVDIDNFKQVNDQFGHLAGDRVIRDTARLLKENLREMDLAGRYGGDEFIVMLPGAGRGDAEGVAKRLLAAAREHPFPLPHLAVRPTLSIGIAAAPADGGTVEDLVGAADKKLYEAKRAGKNQARS